MHLEQLPCWDVWALRSLRLRLDAIAAAAIGGTSLAGGKGSVIGTVLGALILQVLTNGMTLMNVQSYYQQIVTGIVIIVAVLIDRFTNKTAK